MPGMATARPMTPQWRSAAQLARAAALTLTRVRPNNRVPRRRSSCSSSQLLRRAPRRPCLACRRRR